MSASGHTTVLDLRAISARIDEMYRIINYLILDPRSAESTRRQRRLKEKAEILKADLDKSAVGLDKYLLEWRRHSLETAEREIAWLDQMIRSERKN